MKTNENDMTKYLIVENCDATNLSESVNRLCAEGWEPLGGVSVTYAPDTYGGDLTYYQAMVREELP